RRLVDFFPQRHVFLLQPLLGSLAIVDISTGEIPANDLALVVAHRIVPSEKPTEASIAGAHALFQFEGQGSRQRPPSMRFELFGIVRMHVGSALQPLVEADAEILKRGPVGVQRLKLGSEDTDELWCEIQRLPEFRLALAQRLR